MPAKNPVRIHIIGVCGTFMGGIARLARELGIEVSGSDANTYPPMSTQLESLGIDLQEGYAASNIPENVDCVVVGNTISRGNPELEHVLDKGLNYTSGAQWLSEHVLTGRWVLAVAGTHGKTTTSSILAWILQDNGLSPGYLIGGVPENFGESARLGETPFFVIEADEYDTAFSDKRSKFVHYHPRTLILNNLEFDHADIFADLAAIQTQFHHLLKTVPATGLVVHNKHSDAIDEVLAQGVWSQTQAFADESKPNTEWQATKISGDAAKFTVTKGEGSYSVSWPLIGDHNMLNALAAIAAAHHVGIKVEHACESLGRFRSVKRRLEKIYADENVRVFDDFAHHPTAIRETVNALRNQVGDEKIIAVLEPRSNTMKRGVHKDQLADALQNANKSMIYADDQVLWNIHELASDLIQTFATTDDLLAAIKAELESNKSQEFANLNTSPATKPVIINILIMSNGGFEGLHQRLVGSIKP